MVAYKWFHVFIYTKTNFLMELRSLGLPSLPHERGEVKSVATLELVYFCHENFVCNFLQLKS